MKSTLAVGENPLHSLNVENVTTMIFYDVNALQYNHQCHL